MDGLMVGRHHARVDAARPSDPAGRMNHAPEVVHTSRPATLRLLASSALSPSSTATGSASNVREADNLMIWAALC